jgi:hypothetical protein
MALKTEDKAFDSFRGGRYTRNNLVKISDDHVLVANQIYFPGDGIAHKRPGYTLVKSGIGFNAVRIFDFRRQSDGQQFVILAGGGNISWMRADGSQLTALSVGEDPTAVWDFATNNSASTARTASRQIPLHRHRQRTTDKAQLGHSSTGAAPTFTFAAGALTLPTAGSMPFPGCRSGRTPWASPGCTSDRPRP